MYAIYPRLADVRHLPAPGRRTPFTRAWPTYAIYPRLADVLTVQNRCVVVNHLEDGLELASLAADGRVLVAAAVASWPGVHR